MPASTDNCLQPHHLFNLRLILRNANQRYQATALSIRRSLHLTHHARKRAAALGLKVDIYKAVKCPQKQVSVQPLPIIDTAPSPTLVDLEGDSGYGQGLQLRYPYVTAASERPVIPPIVIPALKSQRQRACVPHNDNPSSTNNPSPVVPIVLRGQNPRQGPTSRFSITPDNTLFQVHRWDADSENHKRTASDVPSDVRRSWETSYLDLNNEVAVKLQNCRMSPSASSSSSQTSDSSGPATPDELLPPVTISIKRKSIEVEGFDEYESTEKRLKYVRKDWVHPQVTRQY